MFYRFSKRLFDIVVALAAIVLLLPLFILLFILIKRDSPGPAIFCQRRAGLNGRPFTLYKFRTMRTDIDPYGPSPKDACDRRITGIGRRLREYSLDELPQLFNVLAGQMSIVGPRPLYVEQIAEWDDNQKRRLLVKPGLTGLAQISGRGQLTREAKLELDVKYVDSASFWLDITIIFKTIFGILTRRDIYEGRYSETQDTREK